MSWFWRAPVLAAVVAVLLSSAAPVAHAGAVFAPPDYQRAVWVRVGFTSEGHFSFGVSVDSVPWTGGVEISPRSEIGLVRLVAGVKSNDLIHASLSCSAFAGLSAGLATAFGPRQKVQIGLRLGAHLQRMKMELEHPNEVKVGEGLSYAFSWFGAGLIHDVGAAIGLFDAPNGFCYGD